LRLRRFIISADLGQAGDYTAISIIEYVQNRDKKEYHLRWIERPELGTTYPDIVCRLRELANSEQVKGAGERGRAKERAIVIDYTGVGRPFWDILRKARIGVPLRGITITGGNVVTKDMDIYNVPKRDLITSLQIAFQNKQLKIATGLPLADTLVRELINFKVKINSNGHDQYEGREGVHDDLVLSAAMGVWMAANWYS